ncbi:MAG: TIGR02206 family membrane protein [Saprospiraceae bacterium]|nr:TIGR02206 family membrane protein [Saprospiraceae bacterium]
MESSVKLSDCFEPFGLTHLIPVLIFSLFSYWIIRYKNKWSKQMHHTAALIFSCILCTVVLFKSIYLYFSDKFDPTIHFPFHLCNFLCLIFPLQAYYKKRWFFGILYFWVLVGTFQAILTPDLKEQFPHPEYFKYWLEHCGLVVLVLHGLFVLEYKVFPVDLKNAMIGANIYLAFSLLANYFTGGNYFYSCRKPEAASLLDWLGPWPWYLLTGQFAMLVLFSIYYLPIHLKAKKLNRISGAR